jgi:hypothetical protein
MTTSALFFVFLGVFILGIIGLFANILTAGIKSMSATFVTHCALGLIYVSSGLGALITGIVWIVQQFKS